VAIHGHGPEAHLPAGMPEDGGAKEYPSMPIVYAVERFFQVTQKELISNKAVLYARVSSKEQEREGYSIPAQKKLLTSYAQKHDHEIVKEFIDIETAKMFFSRGEKG